jgi:hypothetical protein
MSCSLSVPVDADAHSRFLEGLLENAPRPGSGRARIGASSPAQTELRPTEILHGGEVIESPSTDRKASIFHPNAFL